MRYDLDAVWKFSCDSMSMSGCDPANDNFDPMLVDLPIPDDTIMDVYSFMMYMSRDC